MSARNLPRVARRIFDKPQAISERGAVAVLSALAPRLGLARLREPDGAELDLSEIAEAEIALAPRPSRQAARSLIGLQWPARDASAGRPFAFDAQSGIAYVPVEGELVHRFGHLDPYSGMTGYDAVKYQVQAAAADQQVRGILLDIDSPGGELYGAQATAQAIFEARAEKPVWALANELAASGAYWLASAAHNVFAPATGDVGSIGVMLLHVDMSRALDAAGFTVTMIFAGAPKVDGNPFEPLPGDVGEALQASVDEAYAIFVGDVARNRGLSEAAVRATEAGVFMGQDARDAGLIDAVASEDQVIEEFTRQLAAPLRSLFAIPGAA